MDVLPEGGVHEKDKEMALGLVSAGLFGDGVLGMVDMPQWKPTPHPKSLVPLSESTQTLVGRVRSYTLGGQPQ